MTKVSFFGIITLVIQKGDNKNDTVRISLYFYNTYEEIDYLIEVLKNKDEIYEFAK